MKRETLAEYIARGGTVKVCEYRQPGEVPHVIYPTSVSNNAIHVMDLNEGALYYSEAAKPGAKRKKSKPKRKINTQLLPPGLLDALGLSGEV
jgi:hypothetical protein